MTSLARLATDLGDLAVATPAGLTLSLWCARRLDRVLALAYAMAFVAAVALTALLKVFARDFAPPLDQASLLSLSEGAPSGHAVLAMLVYGFAAWIFTFRVEGGARWIGAAVSLSALIVVLLTRISLGFHTAGDVAAGLALALPFVALVVKVAKVRAPHARSAGWTLLGLLCLVCALGVFSGMRLSSTQFI